MKNTPGKAPSRQWYFKDWLGDGELQMTSASTRGIWMNLLCAMMDESLKKRYGKDGILKLNIVRLTRLGRCNQDEAELFFEEAEECGFCEFNRDIDGTFTIKSRRIMRESKQRERWRNRKEKQRQRDEKGRYVTDKSKESHPISPTPSPISYSSKAKSKDDFDAKKPVLEPDIQTSTKLAAQRLKNYKSQPEKTEERTWGK